MKIFLKQNWSEQFIYGDNTPGYFVGRENEVKALKNVIHGNDSSAVLISSVRGVGKTSFVHKTLSEIETAHPVFVNIGHALANADCGDTQNKKLLLVSLIRATHFHFEKDSKLAALYTRCFGKYKEEENKSQLKETKKEINIAGELKMNLRNIIQLVSVILVMLGLSIESMFLGFILGIIGIAILFMSVTWQKEWTDSFSKKKTMIIDDSTEYLEIEFENWLREQKDKKLVFVIDELDKIEEKKAFTMIKEYKNLFNRSFAHFIFISSQHSYDLINEDREKNADEGGIYPTLFTHVFYLALPKTEELRAYLNEIFVVEDKTITQGDKNQLINYLLFRSGNDFFELKRLISDVLCFNEKDRPYIDTEKIRAGDAPFARVAKLFRYVDQWFLLKNMKELKRYWKENSDLQKEIFTFLNKNFTHNFGGSDVPNSLKKFIRFLIDIGALESEQSESTNNPGVKITTYKWTGKYKRDVQAPMLGEDGAFSKSFRKMVRVANDLDDFVDAYKNNEFKNYETITNGRDGNELSGTNLHSVFSDYEDTFKKVQDPSQRIFVTTQKTKDAKKIIDQQIANVYDKYFDTTLNLLDKTLEGEDGIFKNELISSVNYNINGVFSSLPGFLETVTPSAYKLSVLGRTDQTRYVLLIKHFEDEEHIAEALSALKSRKDVLVINLMHGNNFKITHPKIFVDRLGRKRKRGVEIKNFINVEFSEFRELSSIFVRINNFLK